MPYQKKKNENIYGQTVKTTFDGFLDSFQILDNKLLNGTELYSKIFSIRRKIEDIINEIYG